MRLVIVGADGKMGCELLKQISSFNKSDQAERDKSCKLTLSAAIAHDNSPYIGTDSGKFIGEDENKIYISKFDESLFEQADAVIDFTRPEASLLYAKYAVKAKLAYIVGTTGFSDDENQKITE